MNLQGSSPDSPSHFPTNGAAFLPSSNGSELAVQKFPTSIPVAIRDIPRTCPTLTSNPRRNPGACHSLDSRLNEHNSSGVGAFLSLTIKRSRTRQQFYPNSVRRCTHRLSSPASASAASRAAAPLFRGSWVHRPPCRLARTPDSPFRNVEISGRDSGHADGTLALDASAACLCPVFLLIEQYIPLGLWA